jgi:hypothetical protein
MWGNHDDWKEKWKVCRSRYKSEAGFDEEEFGKWE